MQTRNKGLGPNMGPWYIPTVRIIALSTIKAFLSRSTDVADAREPLMAWFRQVWRADWAKPADVKRDVRSASILKDGRAVFNVAGNKLRLVAEIFHDHQVLLVRGVYTHKDYDDLDL